MIRVMTWNLWWRFGPWQERSKAILETLRGERPDIVGLQEVWGRGADNQAAWLAGELGMHWAWAPSPEPGRWQRRIDDPTVDVGNAVLSRWPIAEQETAVLPAGEEEPDGQQALYARIAAPGGVTVPFFTTHLISYPYASATRSAQVSALARFVHERPGDGAFPPVVTGDFNAEPDSDEMRLLCGTKTAPAVRGQILLDAWRYAHPTAVGATWDLANPYAARTLEWHTRIDYVLVGRPGPVGEGHVRNVRRAGDGPVDGVWPSDHCAVVADLATEADGTLG
ncbi:endonuclease/exonuclease/phosphatase family protein [Streptomyces sp. CMB-StM0423]|uniref:endonuclease/exonuclease/phosphatase family protein n=1 Tax=Streptomyces sp. CMB-StM0423 TaxID=2059884 RepID=UPI000C713121|nr:endonuclease/exonuclease/phosphatase family protein [Streptomyces sp. CMB-StM0423]AUH44331.1 endonuclease [Streptomyces sp. CMB-StM0423]